MLTIYHNPRCRKSREALELLEQINMPFNIKLYLKDPLTNKELEALIKKLAIKPLQLVRTGEPIWKEQFKGKSMTNSEIISAMVANPKLIERPIVEHKGSACIGRPKETLENYLENLTQ